MSDSVAKNDLYEFVFKYDEFLTVPTVQRLARELGVTIDVTDFDF